MSINVFIDENKSLMVRKAVGHITVDEIMATYAKTAGHPHFKSGMDVIWDLSQAEVGHLSTQDLRSLSELIRNQDQQNWRGAQFKVAIAAPKELNFIVSSTFCILGEIEDLPITVRVFRTFRKAVSWILSAK